MVLYRIYKEMSREWKEYYEEKIYKDNAECKRKYRRQKMANVRQ